MPDEITLDTLDDATVAVLDAFADEHDVQGYDHTANKPDKLAAVRAHLEGRSDDRLTALSDTIRDRRDDERQRLLGEPSPEPAPDALVSDATTATRDTLRDRALNE